MKLLVVEDEAPTAAYLRQGLSEEGFAVDVASDAAEADDAVALYDYDTILLDIMLPNGRSSSPPQCMPASDGFSLCAKWRAAGVTTPILFLTARDDIGDRVRGLDLGGDDYLVKPFAFDELLARIRAIMRRGLQPPAASQIHAGEIVIDMNRKRVMRQGKPIPLTAREYQLLEYLAYHAGHVVTRTALWEHVWESHMEPDSNVVDVYIRYLRNKLGRDQDLIETVRGMGYVFRDVGTGDGDHS